MSGAGRSFAVALVAHAVLLVAADRVLPDRAPAVEVPLEIEILAPEPEPPPAPKAAATDAVAVAEPAEEPVEEPPPAAVRASKTEKPKVTDPSTDAVTVEPTLPAPPTPPGALSMRTDGDALRPADADARGGGLSLTPRFSPDYTPPAEGTERRGPPRVPGDHAPPDDSELRPDGDGKRKDDITFEGKVDRHGTVRITDKRTYDATDVIMRALGDDPYAARKLTFLDRTREERAGMAREALAEDIRESLAKLGVYLTKIWKHTKWSIAERREIYFQLWDECVEPGEGTDGDGDPRIEAAAEARRQIEKFIRLRLPEGGEHGYSEAELETLNKKRLSRQRFDPYR